MQFHSNIMQLNPAFAGTAGCSRAVMGLRNEWPGIPSTQGQNFMTYTASYDQHVNFLKAGVGVNFMYDQVWSLKNLRIGYTHSQYFVIKDKLVIRPGAEITYLRRTEEFVLYSRWPYPSTLTYKNVNTIDISTGLLIHTKRLATGFALYHITQPNYSVIQEYPYPLPRKYVGHLTYLFSKEVDNSKGFAFAPEILYMSQGRANLLMVGTTFKYNIVRAALKYANNDVFIAGVGIQTPKINIGYTYDITTSKLSIGRAAGAHELTASYLFNCKNKKENIKTLRMINL